MSSDLDELAKNIGQAVMAGLREPAKSTSTSNGSTPTAPAWNTWMQTLAPYLALLVAAVIGYVSIVTRVSTLEYQAQISIGDRAGLHARMDKSDESQSALRTDVSEIKVMLKELLSDRDRRRSDVSPSESP